MSHLSLAFLGYPVIHLNGVEIAIGRHKAIALLAYLAVTGRMHSRSELAALLWPEDHAKAAHDYLRTALWKLRQSLGQQWFATTRATVMLPPQPGLWVDVHRLQVGIADEPASLLTNAEDLYRGDFLAGFAITQAPAFEEWQRRQGEALRALQVQGLAQRVQSAIEGGDLPQAIVYAERWLALEPLDEAAHCHLMQLYGWSGQRARALRQYERCVQLLRAEMAALPTSTTTALYQALQQYGHAAPQFSAAVTQAWRAKTHSNGHKKPTRATGGISRPLRAWAFCR